MGAFFKSFAYAAKGIAYTFAVGRNFKVQLCFALAAIVLGIVLGASSAEWAVMFSCMGVVLGGECMNTALESLVDLVSPDYAELAGRAKDCAAGAVLVCSMASAGVAMVIFVPKLVALVA